MAAVRAPPYGNGDDHTLVKLTKMESIEGVSVNNYVEKIAELVHEC